MLSLRARFERAARDLGIDVRMDVEVTLPSGRGLVVPVVLPEFGAENGMLVLGSYETVAPLAREVERAGFGWSVLDSESEYDLQSFVEMLSEWGWNETKGPTPEWIVSVDDGPTAARAAPPLESPPD